MWNSDLNNIQVYLKLSEIILIGAPYLAWALKNLDCIKMKIEIQESAAV